MIDRLDIHAYADHELSPDEMARVEREIAASPEAARELQAIQSLKTCLHMKMEQPDSSASWKVCAERIEELSRVKRTETFVGKYAWAICAFFLLIIVAGGMFNRFRGGSIGMANVASISGDLVPINTPRMSQPEQLRSWISDQTGHRPMLTLDPNLVRQVAYRDQVEGRVVRVRMQDENGLIDLMVFPNVSIDGGVPLDGSMTAGQVNGVNCVTWPDSGCALLLIGDRDPARLRDFARSLYR